MWTVHAGLAPLLGTTALLPAMRLDSEPLLCSRALYRLPMAPRLQSGTSAHRLGALTCMRHEHKAQAGTAHGTGARCLLATAAFPARTCAIVLCNMHHLLFTGAGQSLTGSEHTSLCT